MKFSSVELEDKTKEQCSPCRFIDTCDTHFQIIFLYWFKVCKRQRVFLYWSHVLNRRWCSLLYSFHDRMILSYALQHLTILWKSYSTSFFIQETYPITLLVHYYPFSISGNLRVYYYAYVMVTKLFPVFNLVRSYLSCHVLGFKWIPVRQSEISIFCCHGIKYITWLLACCFFTLLWSYWSVHYRNTNVSDSLHTEQYVTSSS